MLPRIVGLWSPASRPFSATRTASRHALSAVVTSISAGSDIGLCRVEARQAYAKRLRWSACRTRHAIHARMLPVHDPNISKLHLLHCTWSPASVLAEGSPVRQLACPGSLVMATKTVRRARAAPTSEPSAGLSECVCCLVNPVG